jgi:hypothetical protein
MMRTSIRWLAVALLSLSSCFVYVDEDDKDDLQRAVDSYRRENEVHLTRTVDARSMNEIMDEVARHEHTARMLLDWMDEIMDGMPMHCGGAGMDVLFEERSDLGERLLRHQASMQSAMDLDAAARECASYHDENEDSLDDMHQALGSMACY